MPTCIRSAGVATAYVVMHSIMILIVQVTPLALEVISWRFFLIFLISNAIFLVIFFFFFPETKGKTLEEMNALFGDEVSLISGLDVLSDRYANELTLRSPRPSRRRVRTTERRSRSRRKCDMKRTWSLECILQKCLVEIQRRSNLIRVTS